MCFQRIRTCNTMRLICASVNLGNIRSTRKLVRESPLDVLFIYAVTKLASQNHASLNTILIEPVQLENEDYCSFRTIPLESIQLS